MGTVKFKDPEAVTRWPILGELKDGQPTILGEHVGEPGEAFQFEFSNMLSRYIVDFDPGPDLRVGHYNPQEFADTFDVVEE